MKDTNNPTAWSEFEKGLLKENPVFVLLIGLCSSLAVSANVSSSLAMGVGMIVVLTCSNFLISLLRKLIPPSVRVPSYIIVIAGFTTAVEILMGRYMPSLYRILGVYLPLIVVNCIILGRAEAFASKNGPFASLLDGLGMGAGYTFALLLIAVVREFLGNGTLSFLISETQGFVLNFTHPVLHDPENSLRHVINLFGGESYPAPAGEHMKMINVLHIVPDPLQLLKLPPGGFLVASLYLAGLQKFTLYKADKIKELERRKKKEAAAARQAL